MAIAGVLFIAAIIFDMPLLVIIGAIFDWLPLPTKWMIVPEDSGISVDRNMVLVHLVLTLVAYAFAVLWVVLWYFPTLLAVSADIFKILFMEIWWLAVISGQFIYLPKM